MDAGATSCVPLCIEVCTATDCLAMGGHAVLLEIEELGAELCAVVKKQVVQIQRSECLGFCGSGPSVRLVRRGQPEGESSRILDIQVGISHTDKCSQVVDAARSLCSLPPGETRIRSFMQRRADGMRWQGLIAVGKSLRDQAGRFQHDGPPANALEEALCAEKRAAMSEEDKARAERRGQRLRKIICNAAGNDTNLLQVPTLSGGHESAVSLAYTSL